jgi:predicted nuclease of predicted toxin-antitoxin system
MKFIIDAQLPRSLCKLFRSHGHEAYHTLDFERGNLTQDAFIAEFAFKNNAVVISKDQDFYHSFLLHNKPTMLVQVKVGNLKLSELKHLFEQNIDMIANLLEDYHLLELHQDKIIGVM